MPPEQPVARRGDVNRVVVTDGPMLVRGPVEIELPDGRTAYSERPVTAVCVCARSARYPFCDTSHRSRVRSAPEEDR